MVICWCVYILWLYRAYQGVLVCLFIGLGVYILGGYIPRSERRIGVSGELVDE